MEEVGWGGGMSGGGVAEQNILDGLKLHISIACIILRSTLKKLFRPIRGRHD